MPRGNTGNFAGQEGLLDLTGHEHIGLHLLGTALQFSLGLFPSRDVVADSYQPDHLALHVTQRNLGRERPMQLLTGAEVGFLLVEDRHARSEDLLIIQHGLAAAFVGEKVDDRVPGCLVLTVESQYRQVREIVQQVA